MRMPVLETQRLNIRPFTMDDLRDIHQILDVEVGDIGTEAAVRPEERRQWLEWTVLAYDQLARLYQPPYGDRAIVLKQTGELIGACGFVPCLNAFEQLPSLAPAGQAGPARCVSTEFGLFYAISPAFRRQGYATEAAGAMIEYAFARLRLKRIVATTGRDNLPSIGVMRRLGMRIEANPYPDPPWLQVVGILDNPLTGAREPG